MSRLKSLILLPALVLAPLAGWASCSNHFIGSRDEVRIDISDGDCAYPDVLIIVSFERAKGLRRSVQEIRAPFAEECVQEENGFSCKAGGRTPLAGARYRLRKGGIDRCDPSGRRPGTYYQCVSVCKRAGVPIELSIDPYEC